MMPAVPKPRGALDVDKVYFDARANAKKHRTVRYGLVHRKPETPILRRGESFFLRVRFRDGRTFDHERDLLRFNLNFGENSVSSSIASIGQVFPLLIVNPQSWLTWP